MQGGLLHRSTLSVLARKRSTIPCFGTMQTSLMVDEDRPIKSRSRAGGLTHDVRHEVNQGPDRGRNAPSGGCRAVESLMMTLSLTKPRYPLCTTSKRSFGCGQRGPVNAAI